MLAEYFQAGGPLMYGLFGLWVVVLAGMLDRLLYALGRLYRRPVGAIRALATGGEIAAARRRLGDERRRALRGTGRIDAVSQIATSLGLFGTVLGISQAFFVRGASLEVAAPEALASGLATALFTTVAGLVVFLCGQGFLILFEEWQEFCERPLDPVIDELMDGELAR